VQSKRRTRGALSGVGELEAEIKNKKSVLWKFSDPQGFQDTISFFRIVEESRKEKPNKKIVLDEVDKLINIENSIAENMRTAGPAQESLFRAQLGYVRNHIELGRSILKQ
jgi:hypothetical protein